MPESETTSTLFVRNMVCPRCIRVVREELANLEVDVMHVELGEVTVGHSAKDLPLDEIREVLARNGFELIEDQRVRIIEEIKRAVVKLVRRDHEQDPAAVKASIFIAREAGRDYKSLSSLFSSIENMTIERYLILQRVEYVKELLKYGDLTVSEISSRLGYSSVQHCSNQFKSVTGMTPTQFRSLGPRHRHPIDRVGEK